MIDTLSIRSAYRGKTFPETTIQILCDEIDRLRGEQQTPPQGKTVVAKVKVAIDYNGNIAVGDDELVWLLEPRAYYTLTAALPVPAEVEVVARVEGDAPYGYCPTCGAAGVWRERRPNGDDKCSNGHSYPSKLALAGQAGPETRYK